MKRFLKPTGQILTTAVFTSTALESIAVAAAQPVPQPQIPEGDAQVDAMTSEAYRLGQVDANQEPIVPPESSISHEFTQGAETETARYPLTRRGELPQVAGATHMVSSHSTPVLSIEAVEPLSRTAPSLPSTDGDRIDSEALEASMDAALTSKGFPNLSTSRDTRLRNTLPTSSALLLAQSAPSLPSDEEEHRSQNLSQVPPTESSTSSSQLSEPASAAERSQDNLAETQAWLDDTLAQLVERDRAHRETHLRENLVDSAHQQLSARNVDEARRLANNPALTDQERTDLMEAIADVEDRRFYPFVSAERAAQAARSQATTNETPSQEWLMAQMNAYASSNHAECIQVSAYSDVDGTLDAERTHASTSPSPIDEEFVSGGEFLAGIGHQAPSMYAYGNKSDRPTLQPQIEQIEVSQSINGSSGHGLSGNGSSGSSATLPMSSDAETVARVEAQADDCLPTLGQHIGGVTFAALSGYEWMNQSVSRQNPWQMSFPLPISAPITSRFGWRNHPIYGNRRFHYGIDFGAPTGTPVLAALPGRVQTSGSLRGYGLTIIIENDDLQQRNLYAHMSRLAVPVGTWVEQGTVIGWVGSTGNSTGPHLHFEVHRRNGNDWTAVDPLQAAAQMLANRNRREY